MSRYSENHAQIDWQPFPQQPAEPRRIARSRLPAPMVIQDEMDPTQSMLDGKLYTSKAGIRASYREYNRKHGTSIVEVGNDQKIAPPPKRKPKREEIKAAVGRAFSQAGLGA